MNRLLPAGEKPPFGRTLMLNIVKGNTMTIEERAPYICTATWILDIATGCITSDVRFSNFIPIRPSEAEAGFSIKKIFPFIHKEDRPRARKEFFEAIKSGAALRQIYRVVPCAGNVRWLATSATPIMSAAGKTIRIIGISGDVTQRVGASRPLTDNEFHFQTLVETLPQIVWSSDATGNHHYFNERWHQFTGISRNDNGPHLWRALVHEDDRERVFSSWQQCMQTGKTYDINYRFLHHSGEFRWLRVMALPLRNRGGEITQWFGTATDIHAAQQLADERALIAREMGHRINNLFASINSLLILSSISYPESAPFVRQFSERIVALSRSYDIAEPAELEAQSLQGMLDRLFLPYNDQGADRVKITGPDILIHSQAIIPLSLFFHELATNSVKYGALSHPSGGVLVSINKCELFYQIVWDEKCDKVLSPHTTRVGFGSKLLKLSIENRLRGKLTHHWEEKRLRISADIPTDSIVNGAQAK